MRMGILGAGLIAAKNAAAITACPTTSLTFIGARDEKKALHFAQAYGIPAHGSLEDTVTREDVDGVYLALPTGVR